MDRADAQFIALVLPVPTGKGIAGCRYEGAGDSSAFSRIAISAHISASS